MIQQGASLAEPEARTDRGGDEFLGPSHGVLEVAAAREVGGDRGGECASGSVRVAAEARGFESHETAPIIKKIDRVLIRGEVAAFYDDGASAQLDESTRCLVKVGAHLDLHAGQQLSFGNIRRDDSRERHYSREERRFSASAEEARSG